MNPVGVVLKTFYWIDAIKTYKDFNANGQLRKGYLNLYNLDEHSTTIEIDLNFYAWRLTFPNGQYVLELPPSTSLKATWTSDFSITPTYTIISDTIVDINARRTEEEIAALQGITFTAGTVTDTEIMSQWTGDVYTNSSNMVGAKILLVSGYSAYGISAASAAEKNKIPFGTKHQENISYLSTGVLNSVTVDILALMLYPQVVTVRYIVLRVKLLLLGIT